MDGPNAKGASRLRAPLPVVVYLLGVGSKFDGAGIPLFFKQKQVSPVESQKSSPEQLLVAGLQRNISRA